MHKLMLDSQELLDWEGKVDSEVALPEFQSGVSFDNKSCEFVKV